MNTMGIGYDRGGRSGAWKSCAVGLALLALVAGCRRTTGTGNASASGLAPAAATRPVAPAPPPPPATPEELERRVELLYNQTLERSGAFVAMSQSEGSHEQTLRRYEKELGARDGEGRLPYVPDVPVLERQIQAALRDQKVEGATVRVTARDPVRRALPAEVPDGTPIQLEPDDLRGVVEVEIQIPPPARPLAPVLEAAARTRRLVALTRARRESDGSTRVFGEAYWFFKDVAIPRVVVAPPDLGAALRAAGIPPDAATTNPKVREKLDKIRAAYDEMKSAYPSYLKVLELARRSAPLRQRLAFFRDRVERQQAVNESSLFAAEEQHRKGKRR